jgi:hypothetical protein
MPKNKIPPGAVRFELILPKELAEAIDARADPGHRHRWCLTALARAAKVRLPEIRGRGRPVKPEPEAKR